MIGPLLTSLCKSQTASSITESPVIDMRRIGSRMLDCMELETARFPWITAVAEDEVADALRLIFRNSPEPMQSFQVAAIREEIERSPKANRILLWFRRDGPPIGAVWAQIRAGRVAALWPPGLVDPKEPGIAPDLVTAVLSRAAEAGVRLVQFLLADDQALETDWLIDCGFKKAAHLLYVVCPRAKFPSRRPRGGLIFEPVCDVSSTTMTEEKMARLAYIIERTYEKSLDCTALQGVRAIEDVIAGYQGMGQFDPSRWFFVRHSQRESDIGCLLLTEHPRELRAEIIYMGISPNERGNGWGLEIVRYAQWLSRQSVAGQKANQELVLAVDAPNQPAVDVYLQAGFEIRARRRLFLCVIER
jgi:ribosomal protein S18 acetylase RimI-like enzyme